MQSLNLDRAWSVAGRVLVPATAAVLCTTTGSALGAVTYSIDWEGPTMSAPDAAFGVPITEGDLLQSHFVPGGPPPILYMSGGFGPPGPGLGLLMHGGAVGHPPATPGRVEVDALSFGRDETIHVAGSTVLGTWTFSVDEFAVGAGGSPAPSVLTEGALGAREAAADIYAYSKPGAMPPGPIPPFAAPAGDRIVLDGDGLAPGVGAPLGLIEPTFGIPGPSPTGDNLDAMDIDHPTAGAGGTWPVFFSLEGKVFDPIEGFPGSDSAGSNGAFVGGDVLMTPGPGLAPVMYIPAAALGLDMAGADTDDLDALVFQENGDGVYTPPTGLYSWVGGATDMVFFSVRRGSAVIGLPDSNFGIPIEEGDILQPPFFPGATPGIFVAAEDLGLCTVRSCGAGPWGPHGDDLDALDSVIDCNDNGNPDVIEITLGLASDCNNNGMLDDCEGFCLEDLNQDCTVDVDDLINVILDWGCTGNCAGDITRDGKTNVDDLVAVFLAWGPC